MPSEQTTDTHRDWIYADLVRAARELLVVYDRGLEGKRLLERLTPEDIETLRELATWNNDAEPQRP